MGKEIGILQRRPLAGELEAQRVYDGVLLEFERLQAEPTVQEQPHLRAGDHGLRSEREKGSGRRLKRTLQAIPLRRGDAAELRGRAIPEIKNDEREIPIAQEQIGAAQRFGHTATADPEQACESFFPGRLGVKAIVAIDKSRPLLLGGRMAEQRAEERSRAHTAWGGDQFGDARLGQAAFEERIQLAHSGGEPSRWPGRRSGAMTLNERLELDDFMVLSHERGKDRPGEAMCSNEQFRARSFLHIPSPSLSAHPHSMLSVFYHPGYAAPIGAHIMPIHKFGLVAAGLKDAKDLQLLAPAPVTEADLLRVHTPDYIEAVRTGEPRELAESQKFPWSPQLFPSVCLTSGGCLAAARQALRNGVSAALVSGFHHACHDHGEGFCTFNGLVVALEALRAEGAIRTAAVLDMDLHYGNGTAAFAATRPWLFALSIYGMDYADNRQSRTSSPPQHVDGENHRSFALPEASGRPTLEQTMDKALPLLAACAPDVLIYQAGADPYFEDPMSPLALSHADLQARDRRVFAFAKEHRIPIAWVLAGGYTADVEKVVRVHLNTFEAWREVFGGSA